MSRTSERIKSILAELEPCREETRSATEIAKILLGEINPASEEQTKEEPASVSAEPSAPVADFVLQKMWIDSFAMESAREAANNHWQIPYYRHIYSCRPVIGKMIVFGKRVVRKLLKFLIEPITEEQTSFNSAAVKTLNAMRNNDVVFEAYIQQLTNITATSQKELSGIQDELHSTFAANDQYIAALRNDLDHAYEEIRNLQERIDQMRQAHLEENAVIQTLCDKHLVEELGRKVAEQAAAISELQNNHEVEELGRKLAKQAVAISELQDNREVDALGRKVAEQAAAISELQNNHEVEDLNRKLAKQADAISKLQDNRLVEELVQKLDKQAVAIEDLRVKGMEDQIYQNLDYFDFENQFRGSRADVKENQKAYLPHFANCEHVIDLGFGRGEFLELMTENGIGAVGVDSYGPFVDYCRTRGYEVVQEDALAYLQRQKENSCDGIVAMQLVEHLPAKSLVSLCEESYRVLKPGKTLLIETPNPTCLSTYMNAFYMDPSHTKPVHPKTLEYFLKKVGFTNIRIVFTDSSKSGYRLPLLDAAGANLAEFNDGVNFMSDIVFGSQDYAIIAVK